MSVDTGHYWGGPKGPSMPSLGGRIVLFDSDDIISREVSDVYPVSPGMAALVTAYNLPTEGSIHVEAVVVNDYRKPSVGFAPPTDVRRVRPTIGGPDNWVIDADHPQLLIALPGTYRFVLSDPDLLEDTGLVVDAMPLDLTRLPELGALVLR